MGRNVIELREIVSFKIFEKLTIDSANDAANTVTLTSIPTTWFISCTCHCFVFCSSITQVWITLCWRNTLKFNFLEYIWKKPILLNMSISCCIEILVFSYRIIIVWRHICPLFSCLMLIGFKTCISAEIESILNSGMVVVSLHQKNFDFLLLLLRRRVTQEALK